MKGASSEWEGKKKALASEKDKEVVYEGAHLYSSILKKPKRSSYIVHNENPKHQYNENH